MALGCLGMQERLAQHQRIAGAVPGGFVLGLLLLEVF